MNKRRNPEHDLERLLDDDGGEIAAIYRRLQRTEPPRRLDRAVLANAARAVHGGRAPRGQRWLVGLGSAAGIVLAAGIAWQVGTQIDSRDTQREVERPQRSVIPIGSISEPARLHKSEPAEADATLADSEQPTDGTKPKEVRARPMNRKQRSPPPAAKPAPLPSTPAPAPPPVLEQRAVEAEPAPAMTSADEPQAFPEEKDNAKNDKVSDSLGAALSERVDQSAGNAAAMSVPKGRVEQSRAPSPSSSVKLRQNMHLAPQDWLAEIVRLKREGRRQESIENLRLFRRMHPDWQLSDELLRLSQ